MNVRASRFSLIGCVALSLIAGCSKGGDRAPEKPAVENNEPLTLSVYQHSAFLTDEEFQELMVGPVKKKYPNITLELIRSGKGTSPEELITSGSMPDIIYTGSLAAETIVKLNAAQNLNEFMKKNNVASAKFDTAAMDAIKQFSSAGETFALPYSLNFSVNYYNKDIFDKFGVAYPKDGMTWDAAMDLAKSVTRTSDGVQYKGLDVDGGMQRLGEQLDLPVVDPKTLKAVLQTDGWKKAIQTYQQLKNIPGNLDGKAPIPSFEKDRNLAMLAGLGARLGELEQMHNEGNPLNWDMAAMPTFAETPKNAFRTSLFLLLVSSTGKHQEEAFRVIDVLTSEEVQTALNKRGRLTSLKDQKYRQSFGDNLNSLKGKNKDAIFKNVAAPVPPITLYDGIGRSNVISAGDKVINNKADINTALREAEDTANKRIEEEKLRK